MEPSVLPDGFSTKLTGLNSKFNAQNYLPKKSPLDDVETFRRNITEAIIQAADITVRKTEMSTNRKYKPLPYWNKKCSDAINHRNIARNKLNKSFRREDGLLYRKLKGIAQKTIKVAAAEHWQGYCNSLDSSTKLSSVWHMAKN